MSNPLHLPQSVVLRSVLVRAPCANCGDETLHKHGRCVHCDTPQQVQVVERPRRDAWARQRLPGPRPKRS